MSSFVIRVFQSSFTLSLICLCQAKCSAANYKYKSTPMLLTFRWRGCGLHTVIATVPDWLQTPGKRWVDSCSSVVLWVGLGAGLEQRCPTADNPGPFMQADSGWMVWLPLPAWRWPTFLLSVCKLFVVLSVFLLSQRVFVSPFCMDRVLKFWWCLCNARNNGRRKLVSSFVANWGDLILTCSSKWLWFFPSVSL